MALSKSPRITIFVCIFLVLLCCESGTAVQHICGEALSEVLNNLCPNGLAKKFKRSELPSLLEADYYNEVEDDPALAFSGFPFLAKLNGGLADLMAKTRRRRMGVADECCRKGCSYSELTSYCKK